MNQRNTPSDNDQQLSVNRLDTILETMIEGFWRIDNDARTVELNARMAEILGLPKAEVIGRPVDDFLNPAQQAYHHEQLRARKAGEAHAYEIELTHRDGTQVPCSFKASPLHDEAGEKIGSFALVTDITEQKNAEIAIRNSEARFMDFTDIASDWAWETGPDLRFTFISDRFYELADILREDIIGNTRWGYFAEKKHNEEPSLWLAHRDDMENHRVIRDFRYQLLNKDGETRTVALNGRPFVDNDGYFAGYRGTGTDITELVEAQASLVRAKEDADRANQAKSDFLSAMSHELRTPMNAILGFGQMLEFNPKEPLTDAQKSCVDQILKGGNHLLELINDILDLAKIEAGKVEMSLEPVSPAEVLNDCYALLSEMAADHSISLDISAVEPDSAPVRADYTRLKQVLLNLISNAIKYNRKDGSISIDIKDLPDGMRQIRVHDTGMGIDEESLDGLFTAFNRLGAENTDIEGTGIGLSLCKNLVELMSGEIGAQSQPGKGSTFWINIPVAGAELENGAREELLLNKETELDAIEATLLYVEDNPANLSLMELIAQRIDGLNLISTHTAELGIELARSERPDIIILDINLPGMSGIEAAVKLREFSETRDIPVLALSAAATKSDIRKGVRAGFQRYLTKPIQITEIIQAIREALDIS